MSGSSFHGSFQRSKEEKWKNKSVPFFPMHRIGRFVFQRGADSLVIQHASFWACLTPPSMEAFSVAKKKKWKK